MKIKSNEYITIEKLYQIYFVGTFGFKHLYFGKLTDIKANELIFDNNLHLTFRNIIWIKPIQSKNKLYKLVEYE